MNWKLIATGRRGFHPDTLIRVIADRIQKYRSRQMLRQKSTVFAPPKFCAFYVISTLFYVLANWCPYFYTMPTAAYAYITFRQTAADDSFVFQDKGLSYMTHMNGPADDLTTRSSLSSRLFFFMLNYMEYDIYHAHKC